MLDFIETTAGKLPGELLNRGISAEQRIFIAIPDEEDILPGRQTTRLRVTASGIETDDTIDVLIEAARDEVCLNTK
ncbi:MAG: hypothetical protein HQM03_18200 [Magnetococcales bacterium]|nr:hypothetical protein [Magnetococcales bacterium]